MDLGDLIGRQGGVCSHAELRNAASWREIREAVTAGLIVRAGRGVYTLPGAERDLLVATRFQATLAGPSAARRHGWKVLTPPARPWLSIPRGRTVSPGLRRAAHVIRSGSGTREHPVTDPLTTALDCLRRLPLREAVSVCDSALRNGLDPDELERGVLMARGPGAGRMREALPHLSPLSANPFESCLGLLAPQSFKRQAAIDLPGFTIHPDLSDHDLRIVIEGDSWEFHASTPELFARDCERYSLLIAGRWLVLRFTYWQVVHDPSWVRDVIERTILLRAPSVAA